MQQRRDGRRVGRRNDRADQQPAGPGSREEQCRRCSDNSRGDDYSDGSQGKRGPQCAPDITRIGAQPAVKQNDRERDTADQIGSTKVVKDDTARSLFPREHAQTEEDQ